LSPNGAESSPVGGEAGSWAEGSQERVRLELAAQLPGRLATSEALGDLAERFAALAVAERLEERIDALVALIRWVRLGGGRLDGEEEATATAASRDTGRLRLWLGLLEASTPLRALLQDAVGELLAEAEAVHLFGESGLPASRGFLSELLDRAVERVAPAPREARDLAKLVRRLYRSEAEIARISGLPAPLFERFVALLAPGEGGPDWGRLRDDFADGFRLLQARLAAEGLAPKLRRRGLGGPVADSPFHLLPRAGEELVSAWLAGEEVAGPVRRWRTLAAACREEMAEVERALEQEGVSVDIVFGLDLLAGLLTRLAAMVDFVEAPAGARRAAAAQRLLAGLAAAARREKSVGDLVRSNLRLLHRKIVERSGETGAHYVAHDRREYRALWAAAAGGGLLTVGTAAVKTLVHTWHLPPYPEGFLYGLNYAISFLLMHRFHLVLATKQPAMTAATLARILREHHGTERAEEILDFAALISRSQIAAALGNVLVVAAGCTAFDTLFRLVAGRSWLPFEEATAIFEGLSPVDSGTVLFAALTGVLLWLASLFGGWLDNFGAYYQLPRAIAEHPLGRRFGRERMARWAERVRGNLGAWGTNVALGFLLGMTPAVGHFLGVPLDVRHVTLNSGILGLAASGLGQEWFLGGFFLLAMAGVAVMFTLNLGVSFVLSLSTAARAYGFSGRDVRTLLAAAARRAVRYPGDFLLPPRAGAGRES